MRPRAALLNLEAVKAQSSVTGPLNILFFYLAHQHIINMQMFAVVRNRLYMAI
jgi:hypothetical protein